MAGWPAISASNGSPSFLVASSVSILLAQALQTPATRSAALTFSQRPWSWFSGLATVAIITVFSSYIYAMPYHHCPFCILKPEYHYIGFALYFTLIPASFFGLSTALVEPFKSRSDLAGPVKKYQRTAIIISLLLLLILAAISSYHFLLYKISGGEF